MSCSNVEAKVPGNVEVHDSIKELEDAKRELSELKARVAVTRHSEWTPPPVAQGLMDVLTQVEHVAQAINRAIKEVKKANRRRR